MEEGQKESTVGEDPNSVYLHCYGYIVYILVYVCVCCDACPTLCDPRWD